MNGQASAPLHIAVVGGAGAGKSTVVNFLAGSVVAEANPQAGYTRHPTAYISSALQATWSAHAGFLGPLQRLMQAAPANLDEDVYQMRRVAGPSTAPIAAGAGFGPLGDCVIWDCPDMTTWAATGYVPRLMEVASLADIIVYVASDERYNDEAPTQFLNLLIQAGKPVIVCLTKMREAVVSDLVTHFQTEVLGRLPKTEPASPTVPVVPIPFLTAEQLTDPVKNAAQYRIPLLNQVLAMADPPDVARRRSVENSLRFSLDGRRRPPRSRPAGPGRPRRLAAFGSERPRRIQPALSAGVPQRRAPPPFRGYARTTARSAGTPRRRPCGQHDALRHPLALSLAARSS